MFFFLSTIACKIYHQYYITNFVLGFACTLAIYLKILIKKLCFIFPLFSGDVLRHVTQYISNCPSALVSSLPYDEASLVAKITQHLSTTESAGATGSRNNSALFLSLHEQLKSSVGITMNAVLQVILLKIPVLLSLFTP